ncbi:MAG: peptidylprolyl isomerase [Myxococcota bacterium]
MKRVTLAHLLVAYRGAYLAPATVTRTKSEARRRAHEALAATLAGASLAHLSAHLSDEPYGRRHRGRVTLPLGRACPPFPFRCASDLEGQPPLLFESAFGVHVVGHVALREPDGNDGD